ncbi:hypothetical protein [Domibacillus epiphyticus]|uniref:hypothetical protein n=1 Tax=Domibacillus epiphyticus TaxID=1714355 RepID=UPI0013019404|nr:hypothetical protein [Domibacillus epiphyticus]
MRKDEYHNLNDGLKKEVYTPEEFIEESERLNQSEFYGTNSEKYGRVPNEPKISK